MEKIIKEIYLKCVKGEISLEEAKELSSQFIAELYIQHEFERITENHDAEFHRLKSPLGDLGAKEVNRKSTIVNRKSYHGFSFLVPLDN